MIKWKNFMGTWCVESDEELKVGDVVKVKNNAGIETEVIIIGCEKNNVFQVITWDDITNKRTMDFRLLPADTRQKHLDLYEQNKTLIYEILREEVCAKIGVHKNLKPFEQNIITHTYRKFAKLNSEANFTN
jgi:hypothetical protein